MQKGFASVFLIGIIVIVIAVGAGSYVVIKNRTEDPSVKIDLGSNAENKTDESAPVTEVESAPDTSNKKEQTKTAPITQNNTGAKQESTQTVYWQLTESGWRPSGSPPQCPTPFSIVPPADVSLATSVLYPGQYRGGNLYEPGGGFRFDNSSNDAITIRVPVDSMVVGGARFLIEGEMQYVFDLIAPCGVMFRYDHLFTLTPEFQKIADRFSAAKENDTRTTFLNPQVPVSSGEAMATAVGLRKNSNVFISWGVFDLRQKNKISQENPSWAAAHPDLEHYAACPYDFLSSDIQTIVYALPAADGVAGRISDFCN